MTALPIAAPAKRRVPARVLPGFNLTLGFTLFYLCLIVLIPLSALVFKTFTLSWDQFWVAVTSPRVMASYRLTFGASLIAALVNVFFGLLVAWVLVRYDFFGKKIVDALVDLPFALPTAVAGIAEQPNVFFMGTTGGGVWKTDDAGGHWTNVTDGFLDVGNIGAIDVADSDPRIIYVGTGSASIRGNSSVGRGVWKSTDGGATWRYLGLPESGAIGKLVAGSQVNS